jgi:hypothetical protein
LSAVIARHELVGDNASLSSRERRRLVHPEDYILADDGVGRRFADALSEKATASPRRAA